MNPTSGNQYANPFMAYKKLLVNGITSFPELPRTSVLSSVQLITQFSQTEPIITSLLFLFLSTLSFEDLDFKIINSVRSKLQHVFKIKDLGPLRFFLEFEIA